MDKRVVLAVAGAGKTTSIVSRLDLVKRVLIVTYADNNVETIRKKIIAKFGHLPANVSVYSYFTFLHSFCYRPFLHLQMGRPRGLTFKEPPERTRKLLRTSDQFYLSAGNRLYHNRLSKLLLIKGVVGDVRRRIERYFDIMLIDEVQDFGGHDFDLLKELVSARVEVLMVGDFFQSTYTTSRDGAVNKNLHKDFNAYIRRFEEAKIVVDCASLIKSHRCSVSVCQFIRDELGIDIESHSTEPTTIKFVESQEEADSLHAASSVVKLFYEEHFRYGCFSQNWGASKGQDHYGDVCVVLNRTSLKLFKNGKLREMAPLTRNKFYVACTRARGHLYFVPDVMFEKYKTIAYS